MKRILVQASLLVVAVLICSGCALVNKEVELQPVNAADISPRAPESGLPVNVVMPTDSRNLNPRFVGYVRNGLNAHMADVIANKDLALWVQEVLVDNIRNAGYKVSTSAKTAEGIAVYSVISRFDVDMKSMMYETTVDLQVTIKKDNQKIFSKTFSNTVSKLAVWGTESEFQSVINNAMQKQADDMMPDILNAIKRACDSNSEPPAK